MTTIALRRENSDWLDKPPGAGFVAHEDPPRWQFRVPDAGGSETWTDDERARNAAYEAEFCGKRIQEVYIAAAVAYREFHLRSNPDADPDDLRLYTSRLVHPAAFANQDITLEVFGRHAKLFWLHQPCLFEIVLGEAPNLTLVTVDMYDAVANRGISKPQVEALLWEAYTRAALPNAPDLLPMPEGFEPAVNAAEEATTRKRTYADAVTGAFSIDFPGRDHIELTTGILTLDDIDMERSTKRKYMARTFAKNTLY